MSKTQTQNSQCNVDVYFVRQTVGSQSTPNPLLALSLSCYHVFCRNVRSYLMWSYFLLKCRHIAPTSSYLILAHPEMSTCRRQGGSLKKTSMSELKWDHIVTEPEHLLELKAYCCEECGYTLFPARGIYLSIYVLLSINRSIYLLSVYLSIFLSSYLLE